MSSKRKITQLRLSAWAGRRYGVLDKGPAAPAPVVKIPPVIVAASPAFQRHYFDRVRFRLPTYALYVRDRQRVSNPVIISPRAYSLYMQDHLSASEHNLVVAAHSQLNSQDWLAGRARLIIRNYYLEYTVRDTAEWSAAHRALIQAYDDLLVIGGVRGHS